MDVVARPGSDHIEVVIGRLEHSDNVDATVQPCVAMQLEYWRKRIRAVPARSDTSRQTSRRRTALPSRLDRISHSALKLSPIERLPHTPNGRRTVLGVGLPGAKQNRQFPRRGLWRAVAKAIGIVRNFRDRPSTAGRPRASNVGFSCSANGLPRII